MNHNGTDATPTPAQLLARTAQPRKKPPRQTCLEPVWVTTIEQERDALRLTPHEVAKALNLTKQTLWRYEKGGEVTLTVARRFATFYGKTVEQLWPRTTEEQKREPPNS